jgi:dihydrofolate reductase
MYTSKNPVHEIVARDPFGTIGHGMKMPGWYSNDDFKLFKEKTWGCPIIMGRRTAQTLLLSPAKGPLKGRTNIVLSRDPSLILPEGFKIARTIEEALMIANESPGDITWNTGGGETYKLFEQDPSVIIQEIHITEIMAVYRGEDEIKFCGFNREEYVRDYTRTQIFTKRAPYTNGPKDAGNTDNAEVHVYVRKAA